MKGFQILQGFRFNIIIRVLVLVVLCILLGVVLANYNWIFTPLVISVLIIIVTLNLIYYQESTNRGIVTFLTSLRQANFTNHYSLIRKGKSFEQLETLFQDINNSFLKINLEKESHYQYLQALNENIGVGIISYLDNGKIELFNSAAKSIFKKPFLENISDLKIFSPDVFATIEALQKTGGTTVIHTTIGESIFNLSITSRKFKAQEVAFHVVLIQDIKKALDEKESVSWQKLVKVLTHEIMNSATPIASLSEAVNSFIKNTDMQDLSHEDIQDLQTSLNTIENRSKGMVKFVNSYKDYARDLVIKRQPIIISDLISTVLHLLRPQLDTNSIKTNVKINPELITLTADKGLLEQVMINLIKNAIDAVKGQTTPQIEISVTQQDHLCTIKVNDNGRGIEKENLENIFVPFFTTKRNGSGVGLSLSRKIVQLHDGDLQVSTSSAGTTFILSIPFGR